MKLRMIDVILIEENELSRLFIVYNVTTLAAVFLCKR